MVIYLPQIHSLSTDRLSKTKLIGGWAIIEFITIKGPVDSPERYPLLIYLWKPELVASGMSHELGC